MKTKIIALIMILCAFCAFSTFAQQIDPGTGTQISNSRLFYPVWSPDGKLIATCGEKDKNITIIPSGGGSGTTIYTAAVSEGITFSLGKICFSPDSKEIYLTEYSIDKSRGSIVDEKTQYVTNRIPTIKAVNIATQAVRVVRDEALSPCWSRDGRYFGYVNYDHRTITDPAHAQHHYKMAIYDTVTKETKYFAENVGDIANSFSFSGDNTFVAASINQQSVRYSQIWRIPLDGSTAELINSSTDPWMPMQALECSPDGRWIMYEATQVDLKGIKQALFVYDTKTKVTTPIFPISDVWNVEGTWSPDGKKICCSLLKDLITGALYTFDFVENNLGKQPVIAFVPQYIPRGFGTKLLNIDLNTISKSDTSLYQGTLTLDKQQRHAVWSPDGKWIAVSTFPANMIWLVPSAGGNPIVVADFTHSTVYKGYELSDYGLLNVTAFTPDSQEILFNYWVIDESRGTTVDIVDEITSSGSRHFGYSVHNPIEVIRAVNIYTGATRLVMDSAQNGMYSHKGRYLAYQSQTKRELVLYDSTTKQSRILSDNGYPICFNGDDSYIMAIVNTIYTMLPLDKGEQKATVQRLTNISPDNRYILFQSLPYPKTTLLLFDTVTTQTINLLPESAEFTSEQGLFSPDGKKFCYLLTSNVESFKWTRIYVHDFNPADFSSVTSVDTAKPLEFALQGNYPNPFNPSTSIQFSLAKAGKVNLMIYSVAGQKIRELVSNTDMTPGIHLVLWDGHDDFGKPLSSGVYLSRLRAGGKALTGRMLLMK